MAIKKSNDAYSGIVGNTVLYTVKGIPAVRSRPRRRKVVSKILKEAQGNFALVMTLMKLFKPFIRKGYENVPNNNSAFINAMSENLNRYNEAVRLGLADNLSWLQLSKGKLSKALETSAIINPAGEIIITWSGVEPGREYNNYDYLMVMLYNHRDQSSYINLQQAFRIDCEASITLPKLQSGDKIDIIIAFALRYPANKKDVENVSESQWVGQVERE
jgi:hypothetical protein